VAAAGMDSQLITMEVKNQPIGDVVTMLARRLDTSAAKIGNMYFLGRHRPEDRGVLVRKVHRLSVDEIEAFIREIIGEGGGVTVMDDGVVIVSDRIEILTSVEQAINQMQASPVVTWAVTLYYLQIDHNWLEEVGIDLVPTAELAVVLAGAMGGGGIGLDPSLNVDAVLRMILKASREDTRVTVRSEQTFLLGDGQTAVFSDGQRVPVPKRIINESGASITEDFETVQTGIVTEITARDLGKDSIRLEVKGEVTEIVGFVEESPMVTGRNIETRADVVNGGVYLLAAIDQTAKGRTRNQFLTNVFRKSDERNVLQVWARVHRVAGPALDKPQASVASTGRSLLAALHHNFGGVQVGKEAETGKQ